MSEVLRINAIVEEVEASYKFIIEGIRVVKSKRSAILNNHVELQLFAAGFERLLKILLFLKEKYITGSFPEHRGKENFFRNYDNGHGINLMLKELVYYSSTVKSMKRAPMIVEDMIFISDNTYFNTFIDILSDFAKHQRYYYIDIIAGKTDDEVDNFEKLKELIYSYLNNIDKSELTHLEEEQYILQSFIITIEKGTRALSRFFTHGFGNTGVKYYGEFTNFFFLTDDKLGRCKYLEPKIDPQDKYLPIKANSIRFLKIKAGSKSKKIHSRDIDKWAFKINVVTVYNYKDCYFVKIGKEVFSLNALTSSRFKVPCFFRSKFLLPRQSQHELFKIAKEL